MGPAAILSVLVDADTGGATANLKRFDRQVRSTGTSSTRAATNIERMTPALRRMGSSAGDASRGIGKLAPGLSLATRIPVYKFAAIGSAIQAVVPPVVALTSALAPLTGLLGALPGLASAAAQGIGTIALGAKGIGDAIKAAMDVQTTAVKDAGVSLQAHRAAAEQVRSAIRSVGDAERDLSDAQDQSKRAQEDLSTARREATRELVDMRLAAQGAALSEKEARLELTQAIEAQAEVLADEQASALDAREAELSVQRARLGLREATVTSKRSQDDYNESQRKGIKGSDQVVSAQDALHDAQRRVADSQRSLVDATRAVRLAQAEQAESTAKTSAHVDKLQQAMKALPPAGREFARFIISLKPRLDSLREAAAAGIFPGLTRGIRAALQNFGVIRTAISSTASALGELGEQAGRRLGSAEWGRDLQVQGERNVETISRLGRATISLADGFRHIMLAAGPLVDFLTTSAERFSAVFASWAKGARESGKLDAFFQRTIRTTKLVVEAFWDFGRALINVGKIADRVWGQDLLRGINNVAERFRDWTESVRGQRAIEQYFERWRRRWVDIAHAVGDVIGEYNRLRREGKSVADAFAHVLADTIAKLLPAIASQGFQIGTQLAGGILRGFRDSNPLGRLFIAGVVAKKLGLLTPLFALAGRKAGVALSAGVATGATAAVTGEAAGMAAVGNIMGKRVGETAAAATAGTMLGRLRGKLLPIAGKVGLAGVGIVLADKVLGEFSRQAARGGADAFAALKAEAKGVSFPGLGTFKKISGLGPLPDQISDSQRAAQALLPALQAIATKAKAIGPGRAKELREELGKIHGVSDQARKSINNLIDSAVAKGHRIGEIRNEFQRMARGSNVSLTQLRQSATDNFQRIRNVMGLNTREGREAVQKNFRLSLGAVLDFRNRGVINTRQATQEISRLMRVHTGAGKEALKANMFAARRAIAEAMGGAVKITDKGAGAIRKIFAQELKLYGLSSKEIGFRLQGREFSGKSTAPLVNKQRGGPINQGAPSGDTVPAMLERGEYVLNRKAVAKAGRRSLDALNFGAAPRFQKGGGVGSMVSAANKVDKAQFPYLWGGGHQASPAPFGPFDCSGAVSYVLQQGGVQIPTMVSGALASAGKPGPGTVTVFADAGHTFMRIGRRYFGTSGTNPGGGAGWFPDPGEAYKSRFAQRHFVGGGGMAMGRVGEIKVAGPDSALRDMAQGVVDSTRRAANRRLSEVAASVIGAGDPGDPGPGGRPYKGALNRNFGKGSNTTISFDQAAMLAERAGLPGITYAQIAIGESGLRPGAVSSDGGYGLWQMTPRVQSAQTVAAWEKIGSYFNPWNNARQAKYLAGSGTGTSNYFGTGSVTDWNKHYTGPMKGMAKGGVVGYAGDSLGVGTIGPLRGLLDRKVEGHPSSGKTSGWGVGQLIKNAAQHVFDFGTNDATGSAIRSSINTVDRITGKKPIHVMTVNGTPQGGQSVDLKNKAIRNAAGGDVRLVDWAAKHKGQLDALGHGAYPERARLIAESIRRATGAEGRGGDKDKVGGDPRVGRPFRGPLGKVIKKTLSSLRHTKDAKKRGTRLSQLEKRLRRDLGLPTKLQDQMRLLAGAAELYGQRADNAAQLNVDNEDGTTTLGILQGKDQGGWLNDQLGVLLTWRNKILDATKIIEERRKQAIELLERARKRLKALKERIAEVVKHQAERRENLKELRKKPKINKDKIENLRKLIMRVQDWLGGAKREESGLEIVIPSLKTRISTLTGEKGLEALSTDLVKLQGLGGPMNKITGIPPIGQIPGGDIFNTQIALQDLATKATANATDSPVADNESIELLKQLLREANLRTAVSERQFEIFKDFNATSGAGPFMGAFAKGGVALVGENGPELAHLPSGTRIHSASDTASMVAPQFDIHINGDIVNVPRGKDPVEIVTGDPRFARAVEDATRRMARNANRGLAGGGGGR